MKVLELILLRRLSVISSFPLSTMHVESSCDAETSLTSLGIFKIRRRALLANAPAERSNRKCPVSEFSIEACH